VPPWNYNVKMARTTYCYKVCMLLGIILPFYDMKSCKTIYAGLKCNTGIYTEVPTFVQPLFCFSVVTWLKSLQMVSFEQHLGSSVEERLHQDEARVSVSISQTTWTDLLVIKCWVKPSIAANQSLISPPLMAV